MRWLTMLLAASFLAFTPACSLPEGDPSNPEGLFYALVRARQEADAGKLWELLDPKLREMFDRWVGSEVEAAKIIRIEYPERVRDKALAALTVRKYGTGRALFETLLGEQAGELGTMQEMGARVRSVDVVGDTATIKTWGGDDVTAAKRGEQWFVRLAPAIVEKLETSADKAEKNLEKIKDTAKRLKQ